MMLKILNFLKKMNLFDKNHALAFKFSTFLHKMRKISTEKRKFLIC